MLRDLERKGRPRNSTTLDCSREFSIALSRVSGLAPRGFRGSLLLLRFASAPFQVGGSSDASSTTQGLLDLRDDRPPGHIVLDWEWRPADSGRADTQSTASPISGDRHGRGLHDLPERAGAAGLSPIPITPPMAISSRSFSATPTICQRVDELLTIYLSMDSNDLVGYKIKGVRRILDTLGLAEGERWRYTTKLSVPLRCIQSGGSPPVPRSGSRGPRSVFPGSGRSAGRRARCSPWRGRDRRP